MIAALLALPILMNADHTSVIAEVLCCNRVYILGEVILNLNDNYRKTCGTEVHETKETHGIQG